MERQEVLAGFAEVAEKLLNVPADQVSEDARFDEDLGVDSLGLVEFVMEVEDRFDVKIPEEELEGITTVGAAIDLVLSKKGTPAEKGAAG